MSDLRFIQQMLRIQYLTHQLAYTYGEYRMIRFVRNRDIIFSKNFTGPRIGLKG